MGERLPSDSKASCHVPCWLEPLKPRETDSEDDKEVFNLLLTTDWATKDASLASFEDWPFSLRTMVQMIYATDTPYCILWGDKLVCIYNAAYWRHMALDKHPDLMGMPATEAFPSSSAGNNYLNLHKYFTEAQKTRRPVFIPETLWLRAESAQTDQVQEIYTSFKVSTIYGDDCNAMGLLCVHFESTTKVLHARRGRTLRSLVNATQDLTTLHALKMKLMDSFSECGLDFPICLLMLDKNFIAGDWSCSNSENDTVDCRLFAAMGMDTYLMSRHVNFIDPPLKEPSDSEPLFEYLARQAHDKRGPITFETERLEAHCSRRAFGHPSKIARFYPMYADDAPMKSNTKPFGYLLLTLSPVRPVDDYILDYAKTAFDLVKTAFQNFREVARSQARLDEMNAVKQHGEQYFRVLDDSPVGISVQDWTTRDLVFTNKRWKELLGYPEGHPLDNWTDLIHGEDLPAIFAILSKLTPDSPPLEHMHRINRLHTNGKPAWLTVNCSFHREQLAVDQVVTFMTTAIHDSSEQVYAKEIELASMLENQRLVAARESEAQRADEADSAKARQLEYIDTLAHEIRNPISAIVQTVELLSDKLSRVRPRDALQEAEIQESIDELETIDICTTHMSRVINDTLNVSKLEHGSLEIKFESCDLVFQVQSVLRMLQQDMRNKNILCPPLIISNQASRDCKRAITDPLRYKQVVLNLLTNAIKFTALQEGKKEITLTMTTRVAEDDPETRILTCCVKDTGPGMTDEAIQKVFGKFYQASERTHIEYGGSGLGLFISQRLAVLLGGKIDVESELDKGSTFKFEIPAKLASCPKDVGEKGERRRSAADLALTQNDLDLLNHRHSIPGPKSGRRSRKASPHPQRTQIGLRNQSIEPALEPAMIDSKRTVLVVEDNLINQKLMVKQLTMSGFRVLVGNHGGEALEHFKRGEHIDLVVTDIEMPVMNGVETLAAVRALESSIVKYQPPFIACSAYARDEQKQAFLDAGMIDVLAKPHKFADLKNCVEQVLLHRMPFRREYTL